MIAALMPLLVSILVTFLICVFVRRPFGECIVPTFFMMSLVMYISQYLFSTFQWGVFVLCAATLLSVPVIVFANGRMKNNRRYLLTPGFYAFLGCFFVVCMMDAGRYLYSWDELMHWGKMVKEMIRLDQFYCVPASTLYRHKDYPPFVALFEYLWCRLGGKYTEPQLARSLHMLNVSLIVPCLFEQIRQENTRPVSAAKYMLKGIMTAVMTLIVISFCDPNTTINSIYEDITIGLMFSYSAFLVYKKFYRSYWGCFSYLLSLIALIGTKQIGIAFLVLSLFYLLLTGLLLEKEKKYRRWAVICGVLSLSAAAIYYKSWNILTARYPEQRQFEFGNTISLQTFIQRITDSSDRTHREMLKRFIFALFNKNIASGPIPITYFTSFFIVLLFLVALCYWFKDKIDRREGLVLSAVFLAGEAGYAFMMLILYELCFESSEMESLRSFTRYMGSYFLAEMLFLLSILAWIRKEKSLLWQKLQKLCIACMAAIVLLVPGKLDFLVPQGIRGDHWYEMRTNGASITERVKEKSTIYLAYERSESDKEQVYYSYFIDGSWIDHNYYDLSEKSAGSLDRKALENTLAQDDYLYTLEVTNGINKALSSYHNGKKLKDFTLYEITSDDGKIKLTEVETNG